MLTELTVQEYREVHGVPVHGIYRLWYIYAIYRLWYMYATYWLWAMLPSFTLNGDRRALSETATSLIGNELQIGIARWSSCCIVVIATQRHVRARYGLQ